MPQCSCHTQNDVIIELLRHLKGVINFENVVKGSPQFENKSQLKLALARQFCLFLLIKMKYVSMSIQVKQASRF